MINHINGSNEIEDAYSIIRKWYCVPTQQRVEQGNFIVSSTKVIRILLERGYEVISAMYFNGANESQIELIKDIEANYPDIPIYEINNSLFKSIVHSIRYDIPFEDAARKYTDRFDDSSSIRVVFRRKPLQDIREFANNVKKLLVLDKVSLARNIANLCKAALLNGIDGVLFTSQNFDMYSKGVLNQLEDYFEKITWTVSQDWPGDIKVLHEAGFELVAMALKEDSIRLGDDCLNNKKLAIVMGYERDGLEDEVIEACDHTIMIPMFYGVDSLNVNCAGTIAMWELMGKGR